MVGINNNNNNNNNKHSFEDYLKGLEEEKEKILVFKRELPLCLQLVNQAIEACKQQICSTNTTENYHGECGDEEQIISSKLGPIVGEYFPISRTVSDEELSQYPHQQNNTRHNDKLANKKSDWLKSVQLWNQCPDSPSKDKEDSPKRVSLLEVNVDRGTSSGAFQPFKKDDRENSVQKLTKSFPSVPVEASSSSEEMCGNNKEIDGNSKKEEKESKGKSRRSWSGELHRQFLHALQQLGGSHVATPKQIREIMKVDGLTNDEVKSHLQKYRLHERRPTALLNNNSLTQSPQFVVVGGLWVPPPEYTTVERTPSSEEASKTANRVYAPVALPPSHHCSVQKPWYHNDIVNSGSPANSSTTRATTTT